ncbi:MAG TPA: CHAT domain-containing protein [Thermoanaerobaculia bacterium]|nr:CHAT domain-containing protein [Thermoanaerobaculia bacterium]
MLSRKPILSSLLLPALFLPAAGSRAEAPPSKGARILAEGKRLAGNGQSEKALSAYETALAAAREEKDPATEAAVLLEIGDTERGRAEYAKAREALDACLAIREKLDDKAALGLTLNVIGNVEFARGAHDEALKFYERALPLREEAGDRVGAAGTTSNIGAVYRTEGDYEKAIEYLDRSLAEFRALGREPNQAVTLNNLATVYGHLGDYSRALELNAEQLAIVEKLGNKELIAAALNGKGIIETWRGDYRAALAALDRSLALRREIGSRWGVAETSDNLGVVYQSQGNHAQAIDLFTETVKICREIGNRSLEGDGHRNLAREYLATGRPGDAVSEFEKGYALGEATGEKVNMAVSLDGIGRARLAMGSPAEAAESLDRAIEIQTAIGEGSGLAESRVQRAIAARKLRRLDESVRYAREAADLASSIEAPEPLWQAHLAAGEALAASGKKSEAASEFDAAMATIEGQRLRVAGPESAASLYFADKLAPYRERMTLALAAGDRALALELAERSKARTLSGILAAGRLDVGKALTPEERRKERELDTALSALNVKLHRLRPNEPGAAEVRDRLERRRREREAFESALYAAHPEIAADRAETPPLTRAEIGAIASATRAVILDYVVGAKATILFVIRPGDEAKVISIPIGAADLERSADELRRELASRDLAFAKAAREMYRTLLAPAARLGGDRPWIVVPDGPLWKVPFAALQAPDGRFVIEERALSYAPSLAVLRETERIARSRAASGGERELLALGNPKTDAPPLPEAERQVREIGTLYGAGQSEILVGENASENRFVEEAPAFRVLHLATHAVLDDGNPMYSHVLLAKGGGDDGFLEARKLMDLDLRAEMLVLSGCETARGDAPAGEGITGLLWSAFVAGVPTTVASLWRVESASTSDLMIAFHRAWLASRGKGSPFAKAEALRAAARKLIASGRYAHPFYWAGFILAGSPD